jgi:hypothetical protein
MTNGKTAAEIKKEVEQKTREMEMLEKEARDQGLSFSCLNQDQLTRKIKGETSKSPYIYAQLWNSGPSPGSSAMYSVYVSNPDPVGYYPVFASIFFGAANFLDVGDLGEALAAGNFNNDQRWPYMSSRPFGLAPGASINEELYYTTPTAPFTTYVGNCVVWGGEFHGTGRYFDRGLFYVTLT